MQERELREMIGRVKAGSLSRREFVQAMMALGLSKPWPEALETMTGAKQMDASAILDYFAPLKAWLDEQLKGQPVGW